MTDLRSDGAAAPDWAARYLEHVHELPVLAQVEPGQIKSRLPASPPDGPEPFSAVLRDLDEVLLDGITHWQHPRYFAYLPSTTSAPAILAELLAAALNAVAILWRTAPAATELEAVVLEWVAQLLDLPAGWHGHIEDTASTSTLAAIIAGSQATGRSDERNHRLLERVNSSGEIFISGTGLAGRFVLRLAVGQLRTTEDDVRWGWELLKREASKL